MKTEKPERGEAAASRATDGTRALARGRLRRRLVVMKGNDLIPVPVAALAHGPLARGAGARERAAEFMEPRLHAVAHGVRHLFRRGARDGRVGSPQAPTRRASQSDRRNGQRDLERITPRGGLSDARAFVALALGSPDHGHPRGALDEFAAVAARDGAVGPRGAGCLGVGQLDALIEQRAQPLGVARVSGLGLGLLVVHAAGPLRC